MNKARLYNVKPHRPHKRKIVAACLIVIYVLSCWGFFEYGRHEAGFDSADAQKIYTALREEISVLEDEKSDLIKKNASLERSSFIDTQARKDIYTKLEDTNSEILSLKEELVFYRSLLSPTEQKAGLQILSLQLFADEQINTYDYKIFLAHYRGKNAVARGQLSLSLVGTKDNEDVTLSLKDVSDSNSETLKFSFKNYQQLEGKFTLPENVNIRDIQLRAVPRSKRLDTVEQSYTWQSLIERG